MHQRQNIQLINDELKKQVIRIEHPKYGIKDLLFFQNLKKGFEHNTSNL